MSNITSNDFKGSEILNVLISVSSILVAIVVTFLFSKLFAENAVRIERKKEIDELSLKVTYLRRIAHHLRGLHEFWNFNGINAKSVIDNKYKDLHFEEYRAGTSRFSYEEWIKIDEEIYSTTGQAYLALKALEDGEDSFAFYSEINPKNYSLNDIGRYKEYAGSFWYMLNNSDNEIVNFNGIHENWLSSVDELYYKITNKQIDKKKYKSQIKDLFSEFDNVIFEKHYYLTSLNSNTFPVIFKMTFLNMLIFVLIVITSLILYILNINGQLGRISIILTASTFIANTVDLILITLISIKSELNIKEIFRI